MIIQKIQPILNPDNRIRELDIEVEDIVVGGTTVHTFNVPVPIESVSSFNVIYGSGIKMLINKTNGDRGINAFADPQDPDNAMVIECTLEPDETVLFKDWFRNATVQLKFVLNGNTTEYSDIYYLRVLQTIDNI